MQKPIVVNLIAGPGAGKSTIAAGVFNKLKWAQVECELTTEYAKDKVWEESLRVLEDQPYLLGKQHHRLFVLKDKVDVIVNDSPLFLCLIYGRDQEWGETFEKFALELFHKFDNMTYFIERTKPYNPRGRTQDEYMAVRLDKIIRENLLLHEIPFKSIRGGPAAEDLIFEDVCAKLRDIAGGRQVS